MTPLELNAIENFVLAPHEWDGMAVYHRSPAEEGYDPDYATFIASRDFTPHRVKMQQLIDEVRRLREALEFYADPATYRDMYISLPYTFADPGPFAEDFSEDHGDEFYDRPMPGARARQALS